ncbi:unnamed protein product [Rhizophagus irregularis]|nr:unnamed protein product [Rhizophagus irregularis]
MYKKFLNGFKCIPQNNPHIKKKQDERFERHCRRIFKTSPTPSTSSLDDRIFQAWKHRFLFLNHNIATNILRTTVNIYSFKTPHFALQNNHHRRKLSQETSILPTELPDTNSTSIALQSYETLWLMEPSSSSPEDDELLAIADDPQALAAYV